MNSDNSKTEALGQPSSPVEISRREFLKRLGILSGGIVVSITVGNPLTLARTPRVGWGAANIPVDFNAFLRIGTDEKVLCLTGKIEMGQGIITSLPQMLADELDVSYDAVDILMGDTDLCPWDNRTVGSRSTRQFGVFLREAAAEAKGVLKELAAEYLKCPIDRLETLNGVIFDKDRPVNRVTYGRLTKGKIIEKHLKDVPPLKKPAECRVMGKPFLRRDAHEKVTGRAKYAADQRPKGMLYAKILRPPARGALLIKADLTAAEKIDGARVVRDGDFIAVLHKYPDVAEFALSKIKAEFTKPKTGINDKTIFDHLLNNPQEAEVADEGGDIQTGKSSARHTFDQTYYDGYVAHAPIEPHAATAMVEKGRVIVWTSTQSPFPDQQMVARALKISPEKVRIITPYVGGGFGGKSAVTQQALEAARLTKMAGRPVQVAWSRAEEFFYDGFRPASVVRIKSGIDASGKMTFWDYHVHSAGSRGSEQFYDIPHYRVTTYGSWRSGREGNVHPFNTGAWRAPGASTNIFARDLHISLMASKAGVDPLEFRLRQLTDKRMIGVWKAAAKQFGWKPSKAPSGRGYGLASGIDAGTYVAFMVEIEVDKKSGEVRVNRVVCAQDMGFVVNPEGARIQMEGCLTMGLGYALTEDIRFSDGQLFDLNFDTYNIPVFSMLPKIETVLVDNPDLPPNGGGEPAVIGIGGAIATAIHDATGAVLHQQPMTPERVREALQKV